MGPGMRRRLTMALLASTSLALPSLAVSQSANRGGLYDPEPPPDSAYLRIVVVGTKAALDVSVDGKKRGIQIQDGVVSDYLILPHGQRTITLASVGGGASANSFSLEVPKGKAITLAYDGFKTDTKPRVFEDKSNTNKLKSQLSAYNLDPKAGALDVTTADGATRVFTNLSFGASNSIQVNPISVDLTAMKSGEAAKLLATPASLSMTQGASYSVFFVPDGKGGTSARTIQNKTERYSGGRT